MPILGQWRLSPFLPLTEKEFFPHNKNEKKKKMFPKFFKKKKKLVASGWPGSFIHRSRDGWMDGWMPRRRWMDHAGSVKEGSIIN